MPLPIQHQAFQEIRPAQERRVLRAGAADHDVIAAAGAGVAAVDQELVGAEAYLAGILIEPDGDVDRLAPVLCRLDVDLDHAGIWRHLDDLDARIEWWRIAFDMDLELHLLGGRLERCDQLEIILDLLDRRHEGAEHPSRTSTDIAVRTGMDVLSCSGATRGGDFGRAGRLNTGSLPRAAIGSRSKCRDIDRAGRGRASRSASRRPSGESPGIRNR